jgi:hypothetical protein
MSSTPRHSVDQPLQRGPSRPAVAETELSEGTRKVLRPRSFWLWYGVLGPPLIWGVQVAVGDMIFELGCGRAIRGGDVFGVPLKGWSLILTGVCAAACLMGLFGSVRAFRLLQEVEDGAVWERASSFAMAGIAVGFVFFLLVSFSFLTPFLLRTCAGSP